MSDKVLRLLMRQSSRSSSYLHNMIYTTKAAGKIFPIDTVQFFSHHSHMNKSNLRDNKFGTVVLFRFLDMTQRRCDQGLNQVS